MVFKRLIKSIIFKLKKYKAIKRNIYFEDLPISNKKDDYIGQQSYVDFIDENLREKPGLIGIIADRGTGKSSIINLYTKRFSLHKVLFRKKIIKVNLLELINSNDENDILKNIILAIVPDKDKRIVNSRFTEQYKTISFISKHPRIVKPIMTLGIAFISMYCLTNMFYEKWEEMLSNNMIIDLLKNTGLIIGVLIIVFCIMYSRFSFRYPDKNNNDSNDTTKSIKTDAMDVLYEFKECFSDKVLVIEELDRLKKFDMVKSVIKFLFGLKSLGVKCNIIVSITPDQYDKLLLSDEFRDIKPFKSEMFINRLRYDDYIEVTRKLLEEKKDEWKVIGINDASSNELWYLLCRDNNTNIRIIKHRINEVILLYNTLYERFKTKTSIDINTCIFVTYIKNHYKKLYLKLIEDVQNEDFYLKGMLMSNCTDDYCNKIITKIGLKSEDVLKEFKNLKQDILKIKNKLNDTSNLELYCYNYPIGSKVYSYKEKYLMTSYQNDNDEFSMDIVDLENLLSKSDCIEYIHNSYRKLYNNGKTPKMCLMYYPIVEYLLDKKIKTSDELFNELILENIQSEEVPIFINCVSLFSDYLYNEIIYNKLDRLVDLLKSKDIPIITLEKIRSTLIKKQNNLDIISKLYGINDKPPSYNELKEINSIVNPLSILGDEVIVKISISELTKFINENYKNIDKEKLNSIFTIIKDDDRRYLIKNLYKKDKLNTNTISLLSKMNLGLETYLEILKDNEISNEDLQKEIVGLLNNENYSLLADIVNKFDLNNNSVIRNYLNQQSYEYKYSNEQLRYVKTNDYPLYFRLYFLSNSKIPQIDIHYEKEILKLLYNDDLYNDELTVELKNKIVEYGLYKENLDILSKIYGCRLTGTLLETLVTKYDENEFLNILKNFTPNIETFSIINSNIKAIVNNYSIESLKELKKYLYSSSKRTINDIIKVKTI